MARRLPPLNALRAFEASARLGSFVAAASELRVSAAAVSQQVRRLEQYLDTPLFQRLARGLTLTDQGRDYLPELSAGFDLLGESTTRLRAKRADGVLTITTLAGFANGWLLPRLHRFRACAPRIDIVLRTSRQVLARKTCGRSQTVFVFTAKKGTVVYVQISGKKQKTVTTKRIRL